MDVREAITGADIELEDDRGRIPTFPPRALDDRGRLVPISPEERKARAEAFERALEALRHLPDDDTPGIEEKFMRAIDAARPPGRKHYEEKS